MKSKREIILENLQGFVINDIDERETDNSWVFNISGKITSIDGTSIPITRTAQLINPTKEQIYKSRLINLNAFYNDIIMCAIHWKPADTDEITIKKLSNGENK